MTVDIAPFDVTDCVAVTAMAGKLTELDILVNNAGIQRRAPPEDSPEATWHELKRTNLDSVFYVAQPVARGMIARK